MSKIKHIILISVGTLLLIGIGFLFFTILKPNTPSDIPETQTDIYSNFETINVSMKSESASFFEDLSFTKEKMNSEKITKNFKNIIVVNDSSVIMKNVLFYDIAGTLEITYENNSFKSLHFKSKNLHSSSDAYSVLNTANNSISNALKIEKPDMFLIQKDKKTALNDGIEIYQNIAIGYFECTKDNHKIKVSSDYDEEYHIDISIT